MLIFHGLLTTHRTDCVTDYVTKQITNEIGRLLYNGDGFDRSCQLDIGRNPARKADFFGTINTCEKQDLDHRPSALGDEIKTSMRDTRRNV